MVRENEQNSLSLLFVKINRDLPQILKQSSEHQYKVEEIL